MKYDRGVSVTEDAEYVTTNVNYEIQNAANKDAQMNCKHY